MMPFPGGIEDTSNAALLLSLAAAFLTLYFVNLPSGARRTIVKTLAVALLAVLAFAQASHWLLIGALGLSTLGDACLSRPGERAFLGGLASFLIAHVLYVLLFAASGEGIGALLSWRAGAAIAMLLAVSALMRRIVPYIENRLKLPVLLYGATIVVMGVAALTTGNRAIITGAVLFMVSDALLAVGKFLLPAASPRGDAMRYLVWITYYAAQLLITLGFILGRPLIAP